MQEKNERIPQAKSLSQSVDVRLTVVCVQCVFTLLSADGVFHLTQVTSDVGVRVVVDQELPGLRVFRGEENSWYGCISERCEVSVVNCCPHPEWRRLASTLRSLCSTRS